MASNEATLLSNVDFSDDLVRQWTAWAGNPKTAFCRGLPRHVWRSSRLSRPSGRWSQCLEVDAHPRHRLASGRSPCRGDRAETFYLDEIFRNSRGPDL